MKRLLEFILEGCFHEWEVIRSTSLVDYISPENTRRGLKGEEPVPCGFKHTLQCKKCGNLKTYTT